MSTRERGFTLIEVLAVVALTSVVLGVALDFYLDLSNASRRATEQTGHLRRSAVLLDRIARDLQSAALVSKPADTDPIDHPWLFYAESRLASGGADQIKFVSRDHEPRGSDVHESDLAMVAYAVRRAYDESLELMRWSSPRLPESLDRTVPADESQGAVVMAEGVEHFALRFLNDEGQWVDRWDSTTLADSSELPRAVEIQLAMIDETAPPDDLLAPDAGIEPHRRTVLLPVRPLDLEVLLDPELAAARGRGDGTAEEDDEDEEGEEGEDGENEDRVATMDCSDPSSPIHQRTVEQCINQTVIGSRVTELKRRFEQYLEDPFCRWVSVIPTFIVHRTCLEGGLRPGGEN